jgi:hypothetical protein
LVEIGLPKVSCLELDGAGGHPCPVSSSSSPALELPRDTSFADDGPPPTHPLSLSTLLIRLASTSSPTRGRAPGCGSSPTCSRPRREWEGGDGGVSVEILGKWWVVEKRIGITCGANGASWQLVVADMVPCQRKPPR